MAPFRVTTNKPVDLVPRPPPLPRQPGRLPHLALALPGAFAVPRCAAGRCVHFRMGESTVRRGLWPGVVLGLLLTVGPMAYHLFAEAPTPNSVEKKDEKTEEKKEPKK